MSAPSSFAPSSGPVDVEVGWTLNDYQIDVATDAGKQQYHIIIDATAELGITPSFTRLPTTVSPGATTAPTTGIASTPSG